MTAPDTTPRRSLGIWKPGVVLLTVSVILQSDGTMIVNDDADFDATSGSAPYLLTVLARLSTIALCLGLIFIGASLLQRALRD